MTSGRLQGFQDIHDREVAHRRRSMLYLAGLIVAIIVVLGALAVAARWIIMTAA